MSNNNYVNRRPARELRTHCAVSVSEAGRLVEEDAVHFSAREMRRHDAFLRRQRGEIYISAHGIEKLVNEAKASFIATHGGVLPWNLDCRSGGDFGGGGINYGPGDLGRRGRWLTPDEADQVMATWARFSGWLNAITRDCDATARMFVKTQGAGMGAKATKFSLWDMQKRWAAPGKLERMVRAVRDRANVILKAYAGQPHVSNKGIALALMSERTVGKAAVMSVAVTFGLDARNYRTAREALVELHLSHPVVRKDDGISSRIGREPVLVEGDIAVYAAKFSGEGRVSLDRSGWLVVADNRSFHVQHGRWEEVSVETAVSQAREGWERQDRYAREEEIRCMETEARAKADAARREELVAFLDGSLTGYCPLISRKDSYQAGNCQPGTEEWVLQRGWRRKTFIPGVALIPYLGDERVRRVAVALKQEFASA